MPARRVATNGKTGWFAFDGNPGNNRTFLISADNNTLHLARVAFDPPGFTQNFTRSPTPFGPVNGCSDDSPCCIFKDDIDPLISSLKDGTVTGVRAKLRAVSSPYPNSTEAKVALDPHFQIGINGDEFPITLGADGSHYTGAGDNHQVGIYEAAQCAAQCATQHCANGGSLPWQDSVRLKVGCLCIYFL